MVHPIDGVENGHGGGDNTAEDADQQIGMGQVDSFQDRHQNNAANFPHSFEGNGFNHATHDATYDGNYQANANAHTYANTAQQAPPVLPPEPSKVARKRQDYFSENDDPFDDHLPDDSPAMEHRMNDYEDMVDRTFNHAQPPPSNEAIDIMDSPEVVKRPRLASPPQHVSQQPMNTGVATYHHNTNRNDSAGDEEAWRKPKSIPKGGNPVVRPSNQARNPHSYPRQVTARPAPKVHYQQTSNPIYYDFPTFFTPSWKTPIPTTPVQSSPQSGMRYFELSLLSVSEFTISGLPAVGDGPVSSVAGLRTTIRKLSKPYGKATYEKSVEGEDGEGEGGESRDNGEGRWRIPLEAYNEFFAFLSHDPTCRVRGISREQLNIASLGKARLEKGFPSAKKLVQFGVPPGLASTLAPFQRGGVDFVVEKEGRALIADDMGLGKTIQSIAAISIYHKEWPVLILTPSSARYHWENEFLQWLGTETASRKSSPDSLKMGSDYDEDLSNVDVSNCMRPLESSEIHVLTASKEAVIPSASTRVVVCSYGLAPALVDQNKLYPGLFKCAIVDESHMLKNISTRRTSLLVPVLHATSRCILLSGTPALSRPSELWPQLRILGTEKHGWWDNERDFYDNYVKKTSAARRAELHTMLTGTVMIRRLKANILKTLPKKVREKVLLDILTPDTRMELHRLFLKLREGKGVLGKLARQHSAIENSDSGPTIATSETQSILELECAKKHDEGLRRIKHTLATTATTLNDTEKAMLAARLDRELKQELDIWRKEKLHEIHGSFQEDDSAENSRANVLNQMYNCTAQAKIPVLVSMVKKWLADPSKGKLCLFAHHLFVLDQVVAGAGLNNGQNSTARYIRIDGSTSPKDRQAQIKSFQNDPGLRIAMLGITAAGVAVTLTAASTVWFAELFWTPALMIQAEDRCHRIGQSTRVQCIYFVAEGTLDELLWKLLEKKFRDLGEFVEGKEKLELVIHKVYKGLNEFSSLFCTSTDFEPDSLTSTPGEGMNAGDLDVFGTMDLEDDLELMAMKEIGALPSDDLIDDNSQPTQPALSAQARPIPVESGPAPNGPDQVVDIGATEEEAIILSDDEDDGNNQSKSATAASAKPAPGPTSVISMQGEFDASGQFGKCRFYKVRFYGPSYGMELQVFEGRLVVRSRNHLNPAMPKPAQGDILVMLDGSVIPLVNSLTVIAPHLKRAIQNGSVELAFIENSEFAYFFKQRLHGRAAGNFDFPPQAPAPQWNHQPNPGGSIPNRNGGKPADDDDIIEILDD